MTVRARRAIAEAEMVVGYRLYVEMVRGMSCYRGQAVYANGMTREAERAARAVEAAMAGRKVAVVSGGDPGVFGMAGLVLETIAARQCGVPVTVIPGVPAANAAAALLGAPLTRDYATISLSDRLTPLEEILERVRAAARAGFVLALYNPRSRSRSQPWQLTVRLLQELLPPATVVGLARNVGRGEESVDLTTVGELHQAQVDMSTTVLVGIAATRVWNRHMITPRGYVL
ncbi:MAG: precorrin-3B C(17)-methyltransferase [Syntrophomonadaceae bacterium]|nr:precorrin-3B C(17)-methyltransferase [Syntrophomonadaceae bacterium]